MSYREELVQVAAVAVAMVEDFDNGMAAGGAVEVLAEVYNERRAQNLKWGAQHHSRERWLAILMEEVGEAAQAYLQEIE